MRDIQHNAYRNDNKSNFPSDEIFVSYINLLRCLKTTEATKTKCEISEFFLGFSDS